MDGCRIKLIPRAEFYQLQRSHGLHPFGDNSIYPWQAKNILRLREKAYTDNAVNCNAGGVSNGKRVTLFHLNPDETRTGEQKDAIRDTLTTDVFELRSEAPVRGFITGGRDYKTQYDEDSDTEGAGVNSKRLHRKLEKNLHRTGLDDITQIWGRRSEPMDGTTSILYDPPRNLWYLTAQTLGDDEDEIGNDILTLDGLRKAFSTVHLAKGDTLETPEGVFTHREVNYPAMHTVGNAFKSAFKKREKSSPAS